MINWIGPHIKIDNFFRIKIELKSYSFFLGGSTVIYFVVRSEGNITLKMTFISIITLGRICRPLTDVGGNV